MKEEIKKELEELNLRLPKKPERTIEDLPRDYFANMQQSVLNSLKPTPAQVPSFWERISAQLAQLLTPRPALAMASLAALVVAYFIFIKPSDTLESPTFANISEEVVDAYMDQNLEEFDEGLFVDLFSEEEIFLLEEEANEEDVFLEEAIYEFDISELEELL